MRDDKPDQRWTWRGALLAALVLHALVAALVLFRSPAAPLPEQPEITVDLVPDPKPAAKGNASGAAGAAKPTTQQPARLQPAKPQPANAQKPLPVGHDTAQQASPPIGKPALRFGEKDAGPRESWKGTDAQTDSTSPAVRRDPDKKDVTQAAAGLAAPGGIDQTPRLRSPDAPASGPPKTAEVKTAELREAKTLFSQKSTAAMIATTAMGDESRGERAGSLCMTELREQLVNATPPYAPDMLPRERLKEGTVLDMATAAFHSGGQWYDLSYRCEIDADATKVEAFAFHVGGAIPRSEWQARGLPAD